MSEIGFTYELVNGDGASLRNEVASHESLQIVMERIVKALKKHPDAVINLKEVHVDGKVIKDVSRLETAATMITLVAEHINLANKARTAAKKQQKSLAENLRTIIANPKKRAKLIAELDLPSLDKGDILLVGKFKNRRAEIKDFDVDDKGQPIALTDKGDQKIFKPRIAKLMPGADSKDTNAEEPLVKDEAEVIDRVDKKTKQTKR